MTRAVQGIYRMLRPLGLYRLSGGTLVDAELAAYDAGFVLLENALDHLAREGLIQTAEDFGLERRERMLGLIPRMNARPEDRREVLLYRLSITPDDCSPDGILRSVRAAGLQARLEEDLARGVIRVVEETLIGSYDDLTALQEDVRRMLPAHLEAEFEIGGSRWNEWESKGLPFQRLDTMDQPWNRVDLYGTLLLKGGEQPDAQHQ